MMKNVKLVPNRNILPILTMDGKDAFGDISSLCDSSSSLKNTGTITNRAVLIFSMPSLLIPTFRDVMDSCLNYHPTELLSENEEVQYLVSSLGFTKEELYYLSRHGYKDDDTSEIHKVQNRVIFAEVISKSFSQCSFFSRFNHSYILPSLSDLRIIIPYADSSAVSKSHREKNDESLKYIDPRCHDNNPLFQYSKPAKIIQQLSNTLHNVKTLKQAIKTDILTAQYLCRSEVGKHPRVCHQLQGWSIQQFEKISENIRSSFMIASFYRWKQISGLLKRREKVHLYKRYQSMRILWKLFERRLWKTKYYGWLKWMEFINVQRCIEQMNLERQMTQIIQTSWRGKQARIMRKKLHYEKKIKLTIHIQSILRSKLAKKMFHQMMERKYKEMTAYYLQSAFRCKQARKTLNNLQETKKQSVAIIQLQKRSRGLLERKKYQIKQVEKLEYDSATHIQRIVRGHFGHKLAKEYKISLYKTRMIIKTQKRIRIFLSKRKVEKLQEEKIRQVVKMKTSCILIQRMFRGHRERILVKLRKKTHATVLRRRQRASIKIQSFMRRINAITLVTKLKQERHKKMIADARLWYEIWSDDANCWYYYNEDQNESLWEPPAKGYTKANKKLILQNGSIIDDPLLIMSDEEKRSQEKELTCVDCEKAKATRLCHQCGDKYCTACYLIAHPKGGKRATHTFVRIGSVECEECNNCLAKRWCVQCDDPFCIECWKKIHEKGNRSMHRYCNIDKSGNVSPRQWDPNGDFVGIYGRDGNSEIINAYTCSKNDASQMPFDKWCHEDHYVGSTTSNAILASNEETQLNSNENSQWYWSQYNNEDGIPYFYNSMTGESTYENPFELANQTSFANNHTATNSYRTQSNYLNRNADNPNHFHGNTIENYEGNSEGVSVPGDAFFNMREQYAIPGNLNGLYQNHWDQDYDNQGQMQYHNSVTGEISYSTQE